MGKRGYSLECWSTGFTTDSHCQNQIFHARRLSTSILSDHSNHSFRFSRWGVCTDLTPELIWRLRVPKRSSSLPLRWKPEVLNTPLLRCFDRTTYGYELHPSLPMTYESSRRALKELGRDARFEDDIGHYNFRRWAANEVNHELLQC